MSPENQAYDNAAEAFVEHVIPCPACSMLGPHCPLGGGPGVTLRMEASW